jgi:hypothetical protein
MKSSRRVLATLLVGAAMTLYGCADRTATEPAPAGPQASLIADLIRMVRIIDSCASLPTETVTKTIGKEGGVITIGPDTLTVPPYALTKPVTIEASLPDGYFVNVVVFHPDGLRFKKPASLAMGYSNCNVLNGWPVQIAQVTDDLEVIEYLRSTDNRKTKTVTGEVRHFSNYAVAW